MKNIFLPNKKLTNKVVKDILKFVGLLLIFISAYELSLYFIDNYLYLISENAHPTIVHATTSRLIFYISYIITSMFFIYLYSLLYKERKSIEKTEKHFQAIIEATQSGIMVIEKDTNKIIYVNPAFIRLLGYDTKEELIGYTCYQKVCSSCKEDLCPAKENGYKLHNHNCHVLNKNKELKECIKNVVLLTINKKEYLLESFIDVSDKKFIESLLAEQESKYKFLAENISDVLWMVDTALNYVYLSPSHYQLTGYTVEESKKNLAINNIYAEDRQALIQALEERIEKQDYSKTTIEHRMVHKKGIHLF